VPIAFVFRMWSYRFHPEKEHNSETCIFPYGITSMSAGSKTEPGGYSDSEALKQFEIHDDRSPEAVAAMIRSKQYEPVWKDWDAVLIP
jgi:2-iminoacetate synthase ThiH